MKFNGGNIINNINMKSIYIIAAGTVVPLN